MQAFSSPALDAQRRIQVRQRLVEQNTRGLLRSRASATRWRWPPGAGAPAREQRLDPVFAALRTLFSISSRAELRIFSRGLLS